MAGLAQAEEDSGTSTFAELTTTFTPPPECTSWYIDECTDTNCYAEAFPTGTGLCGDGSDATTSYACYPKVTSSTETVANGEFIRISEVATYSPGLYCPLGMSTATSIPLLDGVFCCPSGLTFQGGLDGGSCARTQTRGTFMQSSYCNRTTIAGPTGSLTTTISIYAMPLFLGGQKLLSSSSFSSTSALTTQQGTSTSTATPAPSRTTTPEVVASNSGPPIGLRLGLGIGIPLAVTSLLALLGGFWCIRRYRRKGAWKTQGYQRHSPQILTFGESMQEKPELEGSALQPSYAKAELDPSVTRVELEAPYEGNGAGIYVHKPELQATDGLPGRSALGTYVQTKGELEASTTIHTSA
ncbi:hypothetical protein O1611_g7416 [Lasiodiplodia mahajangana]|uniref:Uncharacterized protein n=1 Tax=Lasiodiplodia mahajangana TaxID=1108764 RepID=A0ACC2JFY5_9PEZI|nr:hypothetical protein O1611_g7416 [Lasiodiplodia mahajangana]